MIGSVPRSWIHPAPPPHGRSLGSSVPRSFTGRVASDEILSIPPFPLVYSAHTEQASSPLWAATMCSGCTLVILYFGRSSTEQSEHLASPPHGALQNHRTHIFRNK